MNNQGTKLFHMLDEKSLQNLEKAGFSAEKLDENIKKREEKQKELQERKEKNFEEKRMLSIFFSIITQKNKADQLKKLKSFGAVYINSRGRTEFRPFSKYKPAFMRYVKNYVTTNTNYRPGYKDNKRRRIRWEEKN